VAFERREKDDVEVEVEGERKTRANESQGGCLGVQDGGETRLG